MTFTLDDDGTLDTIVTCDECGAQHRYNPDPPLDDHDTNCGDSCECSDARIEWALQDAEETHECQTE
ncbi:hypothetical protein LCGC14_2149070 [marine sediment metagenome]|uniref:Uncharacterized protein n=1 Tax=marine sediment metagenome TaxID=412755 RepID=A0A0F9GSB8_9ZZZZ